MFYSSTTKSQEEHSEYIELIRRAGVARECITVQEIGVEDLPEVMHGEALYGTYYLLATRDVSKSGGVSSTAHVAGCARA